MTGTVLKLEEFRKALWDGTSNIQQTVVIGGESSKHKYLELRPFMDCLCQIWPPIAEVPALLIRQEYIESYNALVKDASDPSAIGTVVTGQSGIGKTLFLFYVLVMRLQARQPVAIETDQSEYFVFTEAGVSIEPKGNSLVDILRRWTSSTQVWALSNSSIDLDQPSSGFRRARSLGAYLIQATSPCVHRWKQWLKEYGARMFVMDLWPEDELFALGSLIGVEDPHTLVAAARKWGPSPRKLISLHQGRLSSQNLDSILNAKARKIANDPIGMLIKVEDASLESDVVFVRPSSNKRHSFAAWIPSEYICLIIASALRGVAAANQAAFFQYMDSSAYSCATKWLFEGWVHTRFLQIDHISCHWQQSPALHGPLPTLGRNDIIVGQPCVLRDCSLSKPFYWQPSTSDIEGTDSVLYDTEGIYVIQSTISWTSRSVETGLDEIKANLPPAFNTVP
ncbi:hypothetical protein QCA50_005969 [Cerrena zonata]|uniref:Uncharacterized protein n=1 Tax=Cerrena zonata TaxID=2478898 RepID=A0AAW0GLR8_9APHY